MNDLVLHSTTAMLRAIAAGLSCERVARAHSVAKSIVSIRVRQLAVELQRVVGVVGIDEDEPPTTRLIRTHRDAYLEALSHYVPYATRDEPSETLSNAQLQMCIAKVRRHSRCPLRDEALLLLLFSSAAKPLEIAQLTVADYLDVTGAVRHDAATSVPSGGQAHRPLHFSCLRTREAIDTYLQERLRRGWGIHSSHTYRGLDPAAPLFLSRSGQPMRMTPLAGGRYVLCKEIHEIYRRLFSYGDLQGFHAANARRAAALKMRSSGASRREIGDALGLKKLAVHRLLHRPPSTSPRPSGKTLRCLRMPIPSDPPVPLPP